MKSILSFILVIVLNSWALGPSSETNEIKWTSGAKKKTHKAINKIWGTKEANLKQIPIHSERIADNSLKQIKYQDKVLGYVCLKRAQGCRIGGCKEGQDMVNLESCMSGPGDFELFDYIIILDTDLVVKNISIVEYPGEYGYEISSRSWLRQFIGYDGRGLNYGSDIDGISGATISGNSLTNDVVTTYAELNRLLQNKLSLKN